MRMLRMTGGRHTRTNDPQWDNVDSQWESSDNNGHDYEVEDSYATEAVSEEQDVTHDQDQDGSEDFDEDDQDGYI